MLAYILKKYLVNFFLFFLLIPTLIYQFFCNFRNVVFNLDNGVFLSHANILFSDTNLYNLPTDGPVTAFFFGPISLLIWGGAIIFDQPETALRSASFLHLVFCLFPFFVYNFLLSRSNFFNKLYNLLFLFGLILTFSFTRKLFFDLNPNATAATFIALACLIDRSDTKKTYISTLFLTLAIFCKLESIFAFIGFFAHIFRSNGKSYATKFFLFFLINLGLLALTFIALFSENTESFFIYLISIPYSQPLKPFNDSLHLLLANIVFILFSFFIFHISSVFKETNKDKLTTNNELSRLIIYIVAFSLPSTLIACFSILNSQNTHVFHYFLLLLNFITFDNFKNSQKLKKYVSICILVIAVSFSEINNSKSINLNINLDRQAINTLSTHGDLAYFPWNPLPSIKIKNKIEHMAPGILAFINAGYQIDSDILERSISEHTKYIIFPKNQESLYFLKIIKKFNTITKLDSLNENWRVYVKGDLKN